jgi:hypothetical protein
MLWQPQGPVAQNFFRSGRNPPCHLHCERHWHTWYYRLFHTDHSMYLHWWEWRPSLTFVRDNLGLLSDPDLPIYYYLVPSQTLAFCCFLETSPAETCWLVFMPIWSAWTLWPQFHPSAPSLVPSLQLLSSSFIFLTLFWSRIKLSRGLWLYHFHFSPPSTSASCIFYITHKSICTQGLESSLYEKVANKDMDVFKWEKFSIIYFI